MTIHTTPARALPGALAKPLSIPVIASPLFIISNPDLVIAQCKAGVIGSFPSLNARPVSLLDEWLAGLNPTELKIGIALIEQLRAEGCTIVIVEHVMHAIRSLCDRCIVMNSGAKIAEGTPAEVLADHGVIRAYLGDENA